jgi:hypothetical protein
VSSTFLASDDTADFKSSRSVVPEGIVISRYVGSSGFASFSAAAAVDVPSSVAFPTAAVSVFEPPQAAQNPASVSAHNHFTENLLMRIHPIRRADEYPKTSFTGQN